MYDDLGQRDEALECLRNARTGIEAYQEANHHVLEIKKCIMDRIKISARHQKESELPRPWCIDEDKSTCSQLEQQHDSRLVLDEVKHEHQGHSPEDRACSHKQEQAHPGQRQ